MFPTHSLSPLNNSILASELREIMESLLSHLRYELVFSKSSNLPKPAAHSKGLVTPLETYLFVLQARNQMAWVNRTERKVVISDASPLYCNPTENYSRLNMGRFLNQLCALILTLDGFTVFHGNVLLLPNHVTVAILGESGKGKSTLSFALTTLGAQLISDDLCAFDGHTMEIKFKCPTLSLSPSTFRQFKKDWEMAFQNSKLTLKVESSCELTQIPKLSCAFKLAPHQGTSLSFQRLTPAESIFEYLKCSIIDPREVGISIQSYLESRINFQTSLPLSLFHIPRNFHYLNAACKKILEA